MSEGKWLHFEDFSSVINQCKWHANLQWVFALVFLFNRHRYKAKIYIKENYNMEECADTTGK